MDDRGYKRPEGHTLALAFPFTTATLWLHLAKPVREKEERIGEWEGTRGAEPAGASRAAEIAGVRGDAVVFSLVVALSACLASS
jgi:hypothetical protein